MKPSSPFILSLVILVSQGRAWAAPPLDLEGFLTQVRRGNQGFQSAEQGSQGARQRLREGELVFAPSLFANAQLADDRSPKTAPAFQGVQTLFNSYNVGIQKAWDFGLSSKLAYTATYTEIRGTTGALLPQPIFHDARPTLDLSFPLLRNGLGAEFRAQSELQLAQAEAARASESFRARGILAQAETSYWRLAAAREIVRVQRETLDRAQKMVEWNQRRVRLHLADESDLKQAEALLKLRRIELQAATDEERMAGRAFNGSRGIDSDTVEEAIQPLEPTRGSWPAMPKREGPREDTVALVAQAQASEQAARSGLERNRPNLEVYTSLSLNGRRVDLPGAVSDSFKTNQSANAVGLRLVMPLDLGIVSDNRAGYRQEALGADLRASRARFEEETSWQDLAKRYDETRLRLDLLGDLEAAQKSKFLYERDRHSRGKSTVFLVLQFEQDYNAAQVGRLRAEAELLGILANLKVWSR